MLWGQVLQQRVDEGVADSWRGHAPNDLACISGERIDRPRGFLTTRRRTLWLLPSEPPTNRHRAHTSPPEELPIPQALLAPRVALPTAGKRLVASQTSPTAVVTRPRRWTGGLWGARDGEWHAPIRSWCRGRAVHPRGGDTRTHTRFMIHLGLDELYIRPAGTERGQQIDAVLESGRAYMSRLSARSEGGKLLVLSTTLNL